MPTGSASVGYFLSSAQQIGTPFSTTQAYTVTDVGINGGLNPGTGNNEIFLALVPVDPVTLLPTSQTLSNAVFHTVFTAPATNSDLSFNTNFTLAPGQYALIAGSGLFGATGQGFLTSTETSLGQPTYFIGQPKGGTYTYHSAGAPFSRFFVDGTPANAVPEASSVVSFGLMLSLGLGGFAVARRRKASAE